MAFLGESDIGVMLADLAAAGGGVEVKLGATTVTGLLDREAIEILGETCPESSRPRRPCTSKAAPCRDSLQAKPSPWMATPTWF